MNLFIEYYKPKNIARHGELLACLHENICNEFIDDIFVFVSDDSQLGFNSSKLHLQRVGRRPTFRDMFEYMNALCPDEICITANADIAFDDSIDVLNHTNLDNLFVTISRYNVDMEGKDTLYDNAAAQDVWAFKAPLKLPDEILKEMGFHTGGIGGPDNKLAYLIDKAGYELRNPAKQIKVRHLHGLTSRNIIHTIPGPYLCLVPNDNILIKPEYIKVKEFDEYGKPILL
jgi:hypothetical protein